MTIDLPERECAMFNVLYNAGFFDIANGSAEVSFDQAGNIGSIVIHRKVYKRFDKPVVLVKTVL